MTSFGNSRTVEQRVAIALGLRMGGQVPGRV